MICCTVYCCQLLLLYSVLYDYSKSKRDELHFVCAVAVISDRSLSTGIIIFPHQPPGLLLSCPFRSSAQVILVEAVYWTRAVEHYCSQVVEREMFSQQWTESPPALAPPVPSLSAHRGHPIPPHRRCLRRPNRHYRCRHPSRRRPSVLPHRRKTRRRHHSIHSSPR